MASAVTSRPSMIKVLLALTLLAGTLFVLFNAMNQWLFHGGYAADSALFWGEKCLLALKGIPPRLENLGLVYPPIPYAFTLLTRDPLSANALIGALTLTLFLSYCAGGNRLPGWIAAMAATVLLASPPLLFIFTQRGDLCLLFGFFAAALHQMLRYRETGLSLHLLISGTCFGLLFFVSYESLLLTVLYIPILVWIAREQGRPVGATLLMALFPMVFCALSWAYLNWLFLKDPFYYIRHLQRTVGFWSQDASLQAAIANPILSLRQFARIFWHGLPVLVPYLLLLLPRFRPVGLPRGIHYLTFLMPAALLYLRILAGTFSGGAIEYMGCLLFALLLQARSFHRLKEAPLNRPLILAALALSLFGGATSSWNSPNEMERQFTQALAGRPIDSNLADYREALRITGPKKRILLDDTLGYSLVYLDGNPNRFILPYQGEYETALSQPSAFAEFVVVSREPSLDAILARYPEAARGYLPDFRLVREFSAMLLFQRMGDWDGR